MKAQVGRHSRDLVAGAPADEAPIEARGTLGETR